MSPRRQRRAMDRLAPRAGLDRREAWGERDYVVRPLTGATSQRSYRCPGCEQWVRPGTPHVVVWPADDLDAADRRHWHTGCWAARDRRIPAPRRHPRG